MKLNRSSFSQYGCFVTCRKQFYWKYVRRLSSKTKSKALAIGTAFHRGVSNTGETEEERAGMWYQIGQLARAHWNVTGPVEVDKTFYVHDGLDVQFIADGIEDGYLIEYKTTSDASAENCTAHSLSLQLRLGCALFGLRGTKLRLVKKPLIRLKKAETEEEFAQRYFNLFRDEPQNHFLEIELPANTDGAVREFIAVHQEMVQCEKSGTWPMAVPHICKGKMTCEYMPLCADEQTNIALFEERTPTDEEAE